MTLKITGIELEGHEISVPAGLSEILTNGKAWGVKKEKLNVGYSREIIERDGKLITVLRKR
jgi:hypothetical protein